MKSRSTWCCLLGALFLVLAACGGDTSPEETQEELVADRTELRTKIEETAVITTCELDDATGLPAIAVELANPVDGAWDFESITIGVNVNDPDGFFLADADVVFEEMSSGETAIATTSASSFPDDGEIGECAVFDVVVTSP